jgi:hypothetical protein
MRWVPNRVPNRSLAGQRHANHSSLLGLSLSTFLDIDVCESKLTKPFEHDEV